MKLITRKLAVLVTGLALAASFPIMAQANKGGSPHNNKPCPGKGKHHHKHPAHNGKGKKCGHK